MARHLPTSKKWSPHQITNDMLSVSSEIGAQYFEYLIEQFNEFTSRQNYRKPQLLMQPICECFLTSTWREALDMIRDEVIAILAYEAMCLKHRVTDLTVLDSGFTVSCNRKEFPHSERNNPLHLTAFVVHQCPRLLTWINFNPNLDK